MSAQPAPPARRVLAQAAFDLVSMMRNGEQLLVSLLLPLGVLVGLHHVRSIDLGPGDRGDLAAAGALALAVMSSAFTAQAIATGFDRRYGVLRLLGTTPLGRGGFLLGRSLAVLGVQLIQAVVLGAAAALLGWHPALSGLPWAVLVWLLGTWAFVALALLFAGTLRAEAVLALANLVWMALLVLGGIVVPATTLPPVLRQLAPYLPSGALGDGLRSALTEGSLDARAALVLLAWSLLGTAAVARWFRWSD